MAIIEKKTVWVIMSKDRTIIARGTPRNRCLVLVDDPKNTQRLITYSSKAKAIAGFRDSGFYNMGLLPGYRLGKPLSEYLEAVECELLLTSVV